MTRKIIFVLITLVVPLMAMAQNSVDERIGKISTVGNSNFSSIVQRDPQTHKVEKVVKKLTVGRVNSQELINCFNKEAKLNKTTNTTCSDGIVTTIFTTSNAKNDRIYMMQHDNYRYVPHEVTVTVIVKLK